MDPVVHFEMPYDDLNRLSKFYKAAFGWNMKGMGEAMGNYVLATTSRNGPDGRPKEPGSINGGFFPNKPDWPAQHPSVVIAVKKIDKAMEDVKAAGGQVLGDPMDIPGVGSYVSFVDTEGNRVSLLQPLPMAKPKKAAKKKPAAKKAKAKKAAKKPARNKPRAKK
jgi:predicted enzyme related to lactoylglutathione lyase